MTNVNNLQTAIAYYRVSTAGQEISGLGLEAQKSIVENFCKNNKYIITQEFIEIESGGKTDREILNKALERAKITDSTLIVAKMDRLTRDLGHQIALFKMKIKILSVDQPESNELIRNIMGAVAQEERKLISRRTKDALAAKKARGEHIGRPVGNIRPNQDEINASMAKIHRDTHLKRLKEQEGLIPLLVDNYHLYMNAITKKVQDAGYKNRYGNPPSQMTVTEWVKDLEIEELVREKNRIALNEKLKPKPKITLNGLEFTMEEIQKMFEEQKLAEQENK